MNDEIRCDFGCKVKVLLTLALMTAGSLAMLVVALITAFRARRLYTERMASPLGRWILRLWGIEVTVHDLPSDTRQQRVYISNHTSSLDIFVLIALGLPNTRFFLSGFLRKFLPLGLIGYLTGTIWTVPQEFPEKRVQIFMRAEELLRRTGESVYLSPEGRRIVNGDVGEFNKGAFHLATNLRAPIVPFYIFIPRDIDPGMGYCARPGRVHVYFKPAIDTSDWRIADLIANKDRVQGLFEVWHRKYHNE